jgi:hypothetical protein
MLSHRLCVLAVAGALVLPAAAAELEGTSVPLDSSSPVEVQHKEPPPAPGHPDTPPPGIAPTAPADDQNQLRKLEQQAREMEQDARRHEQEMRDHQDWQRELDHGLQQAFGDNNFDGGNFQLALLIPILAVFFIFGGPIFLLCFFLVQHYRAKHRRQQDINANIDKLLAAGRDIPIELLRGDEPKAAMDSGDLAGGVRNLFLGIGLLIFLTALVGFDIGSIGFILIALGCSRVLIWYLNKPKVGPVTEQQAGQQD